MAEPSSLRSLDEAVDGFLTALRAGKPSPHTITAYAADLRRVAALLDPDPATLSVADLDVSRLQRGFAAYADTHAKSSTARAWSTWNRLCTYLVLAGDLSGNPMAGVAKPRVPAPAPRAFTDTDMAALLDVLIAGRIPARYPWPIRDYAVITTLAFTGLRRAELLALSVGDLEGSPGAKLIAVRHGKGDKYRAIPIDPRLEHLIETYLADRWTRFPTPGRAAPTDPWSAPPQTALWAGDKGTALTSAQLTRIVTRAYRAAGINSHRPEGALVHALRHTFATTLIENGATAIEVMGLLGHASLSTTQRYLATRPDHLRTAIRALPLQAKLDAPTREPHQGPQPHPQVKG